MCVNNKLPKSARAYSLTEVRTSQKFKISLNFTMANLAISSTSLILRRAGSLVNPAANAVLQRREYHEKVIDHYENPRNVGKLDAKKSNVGTGLVGAPACGDVMKLQESSCLVQNAATVLIKILTT